MVRRTVSLVESSSQLQDAPKCRVESCGVLLFLLSSALLLTLCIDYVTTAPWSELPELGHRRYFYESADDAEDATYCHEYGEHYFSPSRGRTFAITTREECKLAATNLGLSFSDAPNPPCVNGCCLDVSDQSLVFSNATGIYPQEGNFPAVCRSRILNLYKLSAIAGIVITGVTLAACMTMLFVFRSQSGILRAANAHVQNKPADIFTVEITFGALLRQQEFIASSRGSWLANCIVITAWLFGLGAGAFVITVVVTPNDWVSWESRFSYVFAFGFMVGSGFGLLVACVRLIEKVHGEKARARSLSYMQMHLFFVKSDSDSSLVRPTPSIWIVRGDQCRVLQSPGRQPMAIPDDRGETICSMELVKQTNRNLENASSMAFADWALKVDYASVTMSKDVCQLNRRSLHFFFEGDGEALRLHNWLQDIPAFCYRGWQNNGESAGATRVITLQRRADALVVGTLMSGAEALEIDERHDELAGSLRSRLADTLRVHPSKLVLFKQGAALYDRFVVGNLDGVVIREKQ